MNLPDHPILRTVDDMGEFRSEHRGNHLYDLAVFSSRFSAFCCTLMIVFTMTFLLGLPNKAQAKPLDVPPFFGLFIVLTWCVLIFFTLLISYSFYRNRKTPLFFALYEKGVAMVRRNGTVLRIFWHDIDEIRERISRGFLNRREPRLLDLTLSFKTPEQNSTRQKISIRNEYFDDSEELCRGILTSAGVDDSEWLASQK